jgi:hypothetical protein
MKDNCSDPNKQEMVCDLRSAGSPGCRVNAACFGLGVSMFAAENAQARDLRFGQE